MARCAPLPKVQLNRRLTTAALPHLACVALFLIIGVASL
jgi:hypothetical protein